MQGRPWWQVTDFLACYCAVRGAWPAALGASSPRRLSLWSGHTVEDEAGLNVIYRQMNLKTLFSSDLCLRLLLQLKSTLVCPVQAAKIM